MTTSSRRLPAVFGLLSLGLLGAPACNRSETAPVPPSAPAPAPAAAPAPAPAVAPEPAAAPAPTAATAPAAEPAAAAAPSSPPPAAAPAHPDVCEVELAGTVKSDKPVPAGQRLYVFIAQGRDCMAKDAHILASTPVAPETSRFFYEVFPKWGSDLSLCAAAVAAPDQPATLYGKATAKFHAEKTGEITYENIVITVKPGPAHTFPAQRQALDPDPPAPKK